MKIVVSGGVVRITRRRSTPPVTARQRVQATHRADVGRSAFYAHFDDEDALLASAARETLRGHTARAPIDDPVAVCRALVAPVVAAAVGRDPSLGVPDTR